MLVEINLLPERERKKSTFIILLASILSLIVIVSAVYLWQGSATKTETASVDRELALTQKIAAKDASNTNPSSASASVTQLENAIKWANDYPIKTIPLMRKLTALLPERGFIKSFAYTEAGTINLTVQFDTESQAAYFLTNLTDAKWIQDASLSSLTTAPLPGANAATNTTVTNQAGTTTASVNGTSTNTTVSSTATAPAANSSQTTTVGTQSSTNNQVQNTQTTANTQTSSTAAASTTANSQVAPFNSNELPRYIGQFEITLNKDVLKQDDKSSIQNGEGGTGS